MRKILGKNASYVNQLKIESSFFEFLEAEKTEKKNISGQNGDTSKIGEKRKIS